MKLNGAKEIRRDHFFPRYFGFKSGFKFSAIIGLGGNIGNTRVRFDRFLVSLMKDRRFSVVESSPMLVNKAFGYILQADFLNATVHIQTSLSPKQLLKILHHYEQKFKRVRSFKNAPRTLDLDILYMDTKVKTDGLCVPHLGVNERLSVIVPLGLMRSL
ncbi:2-amino-4-hydroxy-6-hydroxymethyldihydropteridine pyrophosphokinase [Campylobacter mucosalis]|uniref:2-amino-4-hydroxy-6- hydroxymethyldihydropteridine diphosphokinase n=1 Tax=Campylobacter mucosalis TaxID=202 RepID=UPI0004D728C0|nr:2-amino-4-hydroxy-6-hydroxymethyldihydropteridine diphosphokinase [Campylobacter mucosalis]KEA46081.1 2-amino-4-hydroxy-6-hydroxymethyldihydropteridine pyrophosphokinase [Campylobacter mucosalis]QKF63494.1 6-hydroxymethyl-7,8-dihydropterin pyrophosphokinase [Campylobacter mucosalis]